MYVDFSRVSGAGGEGVTWRMYTLRSRCNPKQGLNKDIILATLLIMAKVTSKLQLTLPKAIADQYKIRPGDELVAGYRQGRRYVS